MTHFTLPVAFPDSWRKMHWRSSRYSFLIVTATITFLTALLPFVSGDVITSSRIKNEEGGHSITGLLFVSEVIAGFMLIVASMKLRHMHFYARFIGTLFTIIIVDLSLVTIFLSSPYSYQISSQPNLPSYLYHHALVFIGILLLLYFLIDESSEDKTESPVTKPLQQEAEVFVRHVGIVVHVLLLTLWPLFIGGLPLELGFALYMLPPISQMYILLQLIIPATIVTAGLLRYQMSHISGRADTVSKVRVEGDDGINYSESYSLQEVHDRIKNNLQLVSSLLSLQGKAEKDSAAQAILRDTASRVAAIATLYRLSDACGYREVDLIQYFKYLRNELLERYEVSDCIACNVHGEVTHVPLQTALYCGLIFNEIVTNSIRHGFPLKCSACVSVVVEHIPFRQLSISIKDKGLGVFSDNFNKEPTEGLGERIIAQLVKQMRAEIEELGSPGHGYRIHIPL